MCWDDCSHLKSVFTLAQTELESPADRERAEQSPNIWDNCDGANDETSEISSNRNCRFISFLLRWNLSSSSVWTDLSKWTQLPLPAVNSWHLSWPKRFNRFFLKTRSSLIWFFFFFEQLDYFQANACIIDIADEISGKSWTVAWVLLSLKKLELHKSAQRHIVS